MNKITFIPVATQQQLTRNRETVRGKPYEKYFDDAIWLHDDALPAIAKPIDPKNALSPTPEAFNTLLEPGYHEVETGYCELPDGTAYVASLVPFPGCTGEMFQWWFWWHSLENARYMLWYPHNHIKAETQNRELAAQSTLPAEDRYIGTIHHVDEYIGSELVKIAIRFVDPTYFGLDTAKFAEAGIVAHACAEVSLRNPKLIMTTMLHLARKTDDGFELRSRYWIGHNVRLKLLGMTLSVDGLLAATGLKRKLVGSYVAYEQLLHDQIEFTHLSTFLADIYHEFGMQ